MLRWLPVLGTVLLVAGAALWPLTGDWRWVVAGAVAWIGCVGAAPASRPRGGL